MENSYQTVTKEPENFNDQARMDELLEILLNSDAPVFIEVHLMVTHGPKYANIPQVFSAGKSFKEQKAWSVDFYDDSILVFDSLVGELIKTLEAESLLDDTMLIIGSDHGQKWATNERIPLLIRFPNQEYSGAIQKNIQLLDIAPTILDYLGLPVPDWMEGSSLLDQRFSERPIIAMLVNQDVIEAKEGVKVLKTESLEPPFYHFQGISVVLCNRWYELDWVSSKWRSGEIVGSTNPCSENDPPSGEEVFQIMLDHLNARGFDTSSLVDTVPPLIQ